MLRGFFNRAANGLMDTHNKWNAKLLFVDQVMKIFKKKCTSWKVSKKSVGYFISI